MKFTERVLLLIINELGLEIRSVKAKLIRTERVYLPLRALQGILARGVNFTKGGEARRG